MSCCFAIAACRSPGEAPPLGSRPEPLPPAAGLHLPAPTIAMPDAGLTASLSTGGAVGFAPDRARAQPLVEAPLDGGLDALMPPIVPRPDGGLVRDAGGPMAPPRE